MPSDEEKLLRAVGQLAKGGNVKIGMIAGGLSRLNGGVSEAVRLLTLALKESGQTDIELFTTKDAYLAQERAQFGALPIHAAHGFGSPRYGFAPGMVRQLLASDIDILHVHGIWTFHAAAAWLWHRISGKPVVIAPHGMLEPWILARSRLLKWLVWHLYLRDLFRRAAGVHVLTVKEEADVQAVVPGAACTLIAHYVPLRDADPGGEMPAWWDARHAKARVIVFFGRLHAKKGVMELCDAWEQLCRQSPDLAGRSRLVFCGWVDGVAGFEDRVARLGEEFGNITFAGPQYGADKWRSLSAASFMILPSHSEGLPLSVVEAWSAGTPTIMTEACNLPDGFAAGAALMVEPAPPGILAGLLHAAQMPEAELAIMRDAARQLVVEHYSATAVAHKTMALYQQALYQQALDQ